MTRLHDEPAAQSVLVQSLARRTREKGIEGSYTRGATEIFEAKIIPALGRQIALMSDLKAHAVHDAGVWRLPDGPAYYAASIMSATTTSLSPRQFTKPGSRSSLSSPRGSMRS